MVKKVIGAFESSFQAMRAINALKQDGIDPNDIHIIAHDDYETKFIEERTGIPVDQSIGNFEEERGLWFEIKSFLTDRPRVNKAYIEFLQELDMDKEDAEHYALEIERGKILLLLDQHHDVNTASNQAEKQLSHLSTASEVQHNRKKEYEEDENLFM